MTMMEKVDDDDEHDDDDNVEYNNDVVDYDT
jgi:hypothetical protein